MLKATQRLIVSILFLVGLFAVVGIQPTFAQQNVEEVYERTSEYLIKTVPNPSFGDEWLIISLARGGYDVPQSYYETYYKNLVEEVKSVHGELSARKYTEYSRVILALSAIGKDAQNVGGYNLVEKLYDFDHVKKQGINGPIYALIALDSWGYEIPKSALNSREKMIETILSAQLLDGGFALSGKVADPDITSMAIQALSSYQDQEKVKKSLDLAIDALKNIQLSDGHYKNGDVINSESMSQVITALTSVSIDPTEHSDFQKSIPNLLSFNLPSKGFKHTLTENSVNGMATEQANYALASYIRLKTNQTKLYDMKDTKDSLLVSSNNFTDVSNHWAKEFIEQAYAQGMLKGYSDGSFKPNSELKRIQAISIMVRALKLEGKGVAPYTDISNYSIETQNEIAAAYEAGIIKNTKGPLNPSHKISREELAKMFLLAYEYVKKQRYEAGATAPFTDIQKLDEESKVAVTFLYNFDIVQGSNGQFKPGSFTTRAHASKMFVNFMQIVK